MGKYGFAFGTINFLVLAFSIASIVLFALGASTQESLDYFPLFNLGNNWSKRPFTSIYNNGSCANKIVSNIWEGTVEGCYCIGKLSKGVCSSTDSNNKCYNVVKKDMQYLSNWKGTNMCPSNEILGTYLDLDIESSSTNCPSNFPKGCGILDDQGNILCVKTTDNCPINDIKFVSSSSNIPSGYSSFTLPSGNTKVIYRNSNTSSGKIFIDAKFSKELPCLDVSNISFSELTQKYELDKGKNICSTSNSAYSIADTDTCSNALNYNNFYNLGNPDYPVYNFDVSLYVKGYVGVKKSCLDYIRNESLKLKSFLTNSKTKRTYDDFYNELKSIIKVPDPNKPNSKDLYDASLLGANICNIVCNSIIVLFTVVNLFAKIFCWDKDNTSPCICCDEDEVTKSNEDTNCCSAFTLHLIDFLSFLLTVIACGFTGAYCDNVFILEGHLRILQNCLDPYNGPVIDTLAQKYLYAKSKAVTSSVLNGLNILLTIVSYILWNYYMVEIYTEELESSNPNTNQVVEIPPRSIIPVEEARVVAVEAVPQATINIEINQVGINAPIPGYENKPTIEIEKINSEDLKGYDQENQLPPPAFDDKDSEKSVRANVEDHS